MRLSSIERAAQAWSDALPNGHGDYRVGKGKEARKQKKAQRCNQKRGRKASR